MVGSPDWKRLGGKTRTLHLDGRIPVDAVSNPERQAVVRDWIDRAATDIGVSEAVRDALTGIVFEIRQGYHKDSKRQNADIANAATAYVNTFLPCISVLSNQIDNDIRSRYRTEKWVVLTGTVGADNDLSSVYDFMRKIVGYDLAAFFERNSEALRAELDHILRVGVGQDMTALTGLKQRADYTHKHNRLSGRHGWLRLTPAYSVKVVEEILACYPDTKRVLDPFCGSGTTALCAARRGLPSATTDINPFLIWLTKVKTKSYSTSEITEAHDSMESMLKGLGRDFEPVTPPPIYRIDWWSEQNLTFLCVLKGAIDQSDISQVTRDLLNLAFCRTLIKLSNAAFNHQSMSFIGENAELDLVVDGAAVFRADFSHVLDGCTEKIHTSTEVVLQDARTLKTNDLGRFDLVVTSPPYANRMSYIRELRPYMYWLGFLHDAREAGELDWQAIGGTWGVATSRLNDWSASENYKNKHLSLVVKTISQAHNSADCQRAGQLCSQIS